MAKIEVAAAADHLAIDRLARILYGDAARPYTPVRQAARTFVARRETELVGFVISTFSDYGITCSGQIDELAVTEDAQGQGIGRDLVRACEEWLRAEGADVAFVSVGLDDAARRALSASFYRRIGFEPCIGPWLFHVLTTQSAA